MFARALRPPARYATVLFGIGLIYRLAFIFQGWSANDEGWEQALGARIAGGQVPYRDFDNVFPPLTAYKEGLLHAVLGSTWSVAASRWLFSIETSLASVLVFLIVRRFATDRVAFLATLPTIFFSVTILTFTLYTYDAEFMALLAIALAIYSEGSDRRIVMFGIASGAAACLALMAKQSFIAFVPAIPFAAVAGMWIRGHKSAQVHAVTLALRRSVPFYLAGFAGMLVGICAYFALAGALGQFFFESFVLISRSAPVSTRFALIQDTPEYVFRFGLAMPAIVLVALILLSIRIGPAYERARPVLLAAMLGLVVLYTVVHVPIPSRPFAINVSYGLMWSLGLGALAVSVAAARGRLQMNGGKPWAAMPPPELVLLALVLQWLAQFNFSGVVTWYIGAFLSLPVVLIFLYALSDSAAILHHALPDVRLAVPAWSPWVLGVFFAAGGIGVVQGWVYEDAPRSQLTSTFTSRQLAGITTYPATAQRVNGIAEQVAVRTSPGDPVFFFPDFPIMYSVTGRTNPTRLDWYEPSFLTPDITRQVLADLAAHPPKLVFLQRQREGTWRRDQDPIDYPNTVWAPIYDYLMSHYHQVDSVQDVMVLVPN